MKRILILLITTICILDISKAQVLKSPDGNLSLSFFTNKEGFPFYKLDYKDKAIIKESRLGFDFVQSLPLYKGFTITNVENTSLDYTWEPVLGEQKAIRDNHNEMCITLLQKETQRELLIRFRLFDDGLGFRYEFPIQKALRHFIIKEELTEFNLAKDYKAFWLPGDYDTNEFPTTTSNISQIAGLIEEVRKEPLAAKTPAPNLVIQTPLMLKSADGLYVNIHEAALINYPAMHLEVDDQKFILKSHLTPDIRGYKGYIQTGTVSPWRTIVVSDDAREILASKLILNLNEPCKLEDTSWIKPVKYVGVWWEYFTGIGSTWAYSDNQDIIIGKTDYSKLKPNGKHGANTEHVKEYIDFAAKNGFDAVLVEGWNEGWEDNWAFGKEEIYNFTKAYPDYDVEELHRYAASKGIKIIMHHETTSSVSSYERQLEDAFRFMVDNGYNAVKTGYVGSIVPRSEYHDGQWMVNHYLHIATTAAKYKIMVNSHEAVRPTGLHRTYPNWIAQESARGTEFESFEGNSPNHTTILPFTRLMGGPMDYTPGIFQGDLSVYGAKQNKRSSTLIKQIALYVTMYSPLQMASDLPENYNRYADVFQFIKDVPVDWDKSLYLEAEPGEYITVARKGKNTDNWFIGNTCGEKGFTSKINLDFLDSDKTYIATIYADGVDAHYKTNPQSYSIRKAIVTNKSKLVQKSAPGGGFAISIFPVKNKEEIKKLKKL